MNIYYCYFNCKKMSVRVNLNSLTQDQRILIRKQLLLQPTNANFARGKNNWFSGGGKDPIQFYYIDKPKNEIVLPYIYGNILLKKHINSQRSYPPAKYIFSGTLRDYQKEPNKKALEQLNTYGTTTLNYSTGAGKSISTAYLGAQIDGIMLIMVNRKTIQSGWVSTFKDFTNADVWVFDGKKPPPTYNVIITMEGMFHKIPKEIKNMISIFVLDECHMFCTPSQVPNLLGLQPKYIITCTATFDRKDGMHSMIQYMAGEHKVVCKIHKNIVVYKIKTGIMIDSVKNSRGENNWSQLVKDHCEHPLRNALIIDEIEQNLNNKIMVLTWNKDHVNLLYEVLKKRGVSVDKVCGKKSNFIDSQVLVGTISKMGTGFDAKNVASDWQGKQFNMVMLTGSTKSIPLLIQMIGRARAMYIIVYDWVDENKIVKRHWTARKKEYLLENSKIVEKKLDTIKIEADSSDIVNKNKTDLLNEHRLEKYLNKLKNI